jgi:hypothetical protein
VVRLYQRPSRGSTRAPRARARRAQPRGDAALTQPQGAGEQLLDHSAELGHPPRTRAGTSPVRGQGERRSGRPSLALWRPGKANERLGRDRRRLLVGDWGDLAGPGLGRHDALPDASSRDPAGSLSSLTASSYAFLSRIGTCSRIARDGRGADRKRRGATPRPGEATRRTTHGGWSRETVRRNRRRGTGGRCEPMPPGIEPGGGAAGPRSGARVRCPSPCCR